MDRIKINRQDAVLEINVQRAKMTIKRSQPEMQANRSDAQMQVQTKRPQFKVNWDKSREIAGQPGPAMEQLKQTTADSRQQASQAISRIVSDGDIMLSQRDAVPTIAHQNSQAKIPTVNVRSAQPGLPEVQWDNGDLSIQWQNQKLAIEWNIQRPTVDIEPYSVEISLSQYPSITVTVEPGTPLLMEGLQLDKLA